MQIDLWPPTHPTAVGVVQAFAGLPNAPYMFNVLLDTNAKNQGLPSNSVLYLLVPGTGETVQVTLLLNALLQMVKQ